MRIVIIEFISLDGVVQAPGGADEDTDGGFAHGGWSHPFFDPEVVGGAFDGALNDADALLFGRRTWQTMAAAWPERAGDPFADQDERDPEVRRLRDARRRRTDVGQHDAHPRRRGRGPHPGAARDRGGNLLVMGSPTLVRTLMSEGLVDELRLIVDAGDPRWRQVDLPRRRRPAHARAGLDGDQRHGSERVDLQAGRRG